MGGTHPLKRRECQETDFTCVTTLAKTDKATMTSLDDTDFSAAAYKALYRIAEHASTEETLFDFGCALHRVLAELIPAKSLYLCLLSERPGRLNFPYYVDERDGNSMQEVDVPMRLGLTEFVLRSGVAELIDQPRFLALQQSGEITQATGDLTFASWLGVPLHIRGRVGGVLTVQSYESGVSYDATHAHLLSLVARHVSTAIDRKQSYDALRNAHAELERETRQRRQSETMYRVFYELAARAGSGDSLYEFSAQVHALLGQLMVAANCYICLCDIEKGVKHFPYYVDERDGDTLQKSDVPLRKGLTEFVVSTGEPQRIDQPRLAQLQALGQVTQAQGDLSFSAWLGVPLRIRGTVDGVLAVQSYDAGTTYSESDAQVLAHVAHHVSAAIERMQAYAAMQRSEERYRNVIEQVGQGMMVLQMERVLFCNARAATMVGFMEGGLHGQDWTVHLQPQDREQALRSLGTLSLPGESSMRLELRLLDADGSTRWLDMGATLVQWEGEPATLAFLSDITQRKQLELALRRTSFEREAMLNTALVGISFNVRDQIVWVNEKCAEMAGLPREELIGQSPRIFYESDAEYAQEKCRSESSLRSTGTYNSERYTLRHGGEKAWVLIAGRCVEDRDPDAGVIWTLLDVTDRRKAEDDIRNALEAQRELNVLRSRFVAMTSHEFRTPLASILSSAELLQHYAHRMTEPERADLLRSIESGVQRMTHMLDRVLLIGKAEAEMLEFHPQPMNLRALLDELIHDATQQFSQAHNRITLDWQHGCATQNADASLCRHIFSNLLSNALKYSPQGGDVELRVRQDGEHTSIEVQDHGIGIPADELHHLFESFHRATNVGAIAGTGLGLSIVKKSVDLHRGNIEVHSELGRGTRFTVRLPIEGQ